jgi:hypothetical protein
MRIRDVGVRKMSSELIMYQIFTDMFFFILLVKGSSMNLHTQKVKWLAVLPHVGIDPVQHVFCLNQSSSKAANSWLTSLVQLMIQYEYLVGRDAIQCNSVQLNLYTAFRTFSLVIIHDTGDSR